MALHAGSARLDAELATLIAAGDRDALAELYDRYFAPLYDFSTRVVRSRDLAADVVQTTFVKAWQKLPETQVENVKGWLFTIARNTALDELRRRGREVGEADDLFTQLDQSRFDDPEDVARDRELVELVWSTASALSPAEYSLLDLHVRQDLNADEVAAALGVKKGALYTRLTRLRKSFEGAVAAHLLVRRGRKDCEDLDTLLAAFKPLTFNREVRTAVDEHVADCRVCEDSKRRFILPAEILAGLAPIPAAPGVRGQIWDHINGHIGGTATPRRRLWRRNAFYLAGAAVITAAAVFGVFVASSPDTDSTPEDPADVHSTTHEVGTASDEPVIQIAWTPSVQAGGYSVLWSPGPTDLPDEVADLAGDASGTASPALEPGEWYFHLRTVSPDGTWTATVHLGPFLIGEPVRVLGETLTADDSTGSEQPVTTSSLPGSTTSTAPGSTSTTAPTSTTATSSTTPGSSPTTSTTSTSTTSPSTTTSTTSTTTTTSTTSTTTTSTTSTTTTSTTTTTTTTTTVPRGRITVLLTAKGDDAQAFQFSGAITAMLSNGRSASRVVTGDTYEVTEMIPAGWVLASIECDDDDSSGKVSVATAMFVVAPGEHVTCEFTNVLG